MRESVENYLSTIYRLRKDAQTPVPLSELQVYFGFSRVSIHEMVRKLAEEGFVVYHPYHGVTLTEAGEAVAVALLRRHRLWERFLTDLLDIPWDEAHEYACQLEHAVPDEVTERLVDLLGDPQACPHGAPIRPDEGGAQGQQLRRRQPGSEYRIVRIAPETSEVLHYLRDQGFGPKSTLRLIRHGPESTRVEVGDAIVDLPVEVAEAIWTTVNLSS
ncbi:MAG: metal-dependent transcriptional regulator [Anaerolineae bacterium]